MNYDNEYVDIDYHGRSNAAQLHGIYGNEMEGRSMRSIEGQNRGTRSEIHQQNQVDLGARRQTDRLAPDSILSSAEDASGNSQQSEADKSVKSMIKKMKKLSRKVSRSSSGVWNKVKKMVKKTSRRATRASRSSVGYGGDCGDLSRPLLGTSSSSLEPSHASDLIQDNVAQSGRLNTLSSVSTSSGEEQANSNSNIRRLDEDRAYKDHEDIAAVPKTISSISAGENAKTTEERTIRARAPATAALSTEITRKDMKKVSAISISAAVKSTSPHVASDNRQCSMKMVDAADSAPFRVYSTPELNCIMFPSSSQDGSSPEPGSRTQETIKKSCCCLPWKCKKSVESKYSSSEGQTFHFSKLASLRAVSRDKQCDGYQAPAAITGKQIIRKPITEQSEEGDDSDAITTTLDKILSSDGVASLVDVLDLMDLSCRREAHRHAGKAVVTASFEELRVLAPIPRVAHIRVSSSIIATGKTSLLLRVHAEAGDVETLTYKPIVKAYSTFVCVNKNGSLRAAPAVEAVDKENLKTKDRLQETRTHFKRVESYPMPLPAIRNDLVGDNDDVLSAASAVLVVSQQYLPRRLNLGGAVFAGELLETTTRVASYAVKRIMRGRCISAQCIAIHHFSFIKPMKPLHTFQITARVAAIKGAIVYVDVRADTNQEDDGKEMIQTLDALFAMVLTEEDGTPVKCPVQIDFDGADESLLRAHLRAAIWFHDEKLDENILQTQEV